MCAARHTSITLSLVTILVLVTPGSTFGDEYCKWTDENGVVHYDERCPDDVTSTIVAAEDDRTESQIRAAEELAKSVQSGLNKPTSSIGKSRRPESGKNAGANAQPSLQDSKDFSQMSVEELDALCEKERERRLAPERERLIQDCITNQRNSLEYCETYYSDYGASQRVYHHTPLVESPRFTVKPALYSDLPECVAAEEARRR